MTNAPNSSNSRVKPTQDTKFHIDYSWWEREGRDLRTYLISHLLPDQRIDFESNTDSQLVDWVDPDTGEVRQVDSLMVALQAAFRDVHYISQHTTLVDAVFRVFLENGNKPLSIRELGDRLSRPPMTILKTVGGLVVYKGIRPVIE